MTIPVKRARTDASSAEATSGICAGPYGNGKSWFLGSILEHYEPEEVLLVCLLAREKDSYWYQKYDVPYVLLWEDYLPTVDDQPQADVIPRFIELMRDLRTDTQYKVIIIDSGTELAECGWHYSMLPHKVATPALMEDKKSRWLPYETLDINLDQAVKAAIGLTMPDIAVQPKHVWFSWHVQAAKDDMEVKGKVQISADHRAKDVEYEGDILPMIRGRFRRRLGQLVTSFIYADKLIRQDPIKKTCEVQYVVQVVSDPSKSVKIPGPVPTKNDPRLINGLYLPNNWTSFYPFLMEQMELETKEEKPAKPKGPPKTKAQKKGNLSAK
jgi:hypothetical protein